MREYLTVTALFVLAVAIAARLYVEWRQGR